MSDVIIGEAPSKIELSDEQMVEDMALRMEKFRAGMTALIQSTNIHPDVAMDRTNRVGITLVDDKYTRADLQEQARGVALARFRDTVTAEELPDTPDEPKETESSAG